MITSLRNKTHTTTLFFLMLVSMIAVFPLSTQAQCGGGFSGFGGPQIVIIGTFTNNNGVLEGEFTDIGYEGEWSPFLEEMNNTVDYEYHGSTFSFLNLFNLFSIPSAFAQCDGGGGLFTPVVSLTATPSTITNGESSTLQWVSSNVTSCTSPDFETGGQTAGTVQVSPSVTTEYEIVCVRNTQQVTDTATVTVGTCSPAYNQAQWYTGGVQVASATERANNPISCDVLDDTVSPSYTHWNRQVTNYNGGSSGPDVYDPIETLCYYYTDVTGTQAKPTTQDTFAEYYFDSGTSCVQAPVAECSDGIDNEPDGSIDLNDAGCTGPFDDDESNEPAACVDGIDNDSDGRIDSADGGCDGTATDDSEDGGVTATLTADDTTILVNTPATLNWQCTDSTTASISTIGAVTPTAAGSVVTANISAAQASYQLTCSDGTASDTDIVTISTSNPTVSLTAAKDRVVDGGSTTLSWDGDQVTACTLTGTNGLSYTAGMDATAVPSGAITTQTTFTVSCDSGAATDKAIVNVNVDIDEF